MNNVVAGLFVEGEVLSLGVGVNYKASGSSRTSGNVGDGTRVGTASKRR